MRTFIDNFLEFLRGLKTTNTSTGISFIGYNRRAGASRGLLLVEYLKDGSINEDKLADPLDLREKTVQYFKVGTPVNAGTASGILTFTDVPTDGDTLTIETETYEFDSDDSVEEGNIAISTGSAAAKASGTLTFTDQPANGDTITIGDITYRFVTEIDLFSPGDYDTAIKGSLQNTIRVLMAAINDEGGVYGADSYHVLDAHDAVSATAADATTLTVEALTEGTAGNSIASTDSCSVASWGDTTLTGGAAAGGADLATVITATVTAITENTTADITVEEGDGDTIDITAVTAGTLANAIDTTTDCSVASFGDTTLIGGVDATVGIAHEIMLDGDYIYVCTATNGATDSNWKQVALSELGGTPG